MSRTEARFHKTMVRSIARYVAGLIVTTAHAHETILRALAAEGRSGIKTLSISLPLAEAFNSPTELEPLLANVPYFVVCGAIEPRKNYLLLSKVWRMLCQSSESAPHLVIVGAPRWRGHPILDQMFGCAATRGKIHHVAELSTPALKPLIAGSLGLLSPSLTEGFGLPIIEALHLGVPVVASDIPAHREVAGGRAGTARPQRRRGVGKRGRRAQFVDQSGQRVARSATDAIRERSEYLELSHSVSRGALTTAYDVSEPHCDLEERAHHRPAARARRSGAIKNPARRGGLQGPQLGRPGEERGCV